MAWWCLQRSLPCYWWATWTKPPTFCAGTSSSARRNTLHLQHSKFTDAPAVLRASMWAPRNAPTQLSFTMQDATLATGTLERIAAMVHALRTTGHATSAHHPAPPPMVTIELVNCAVVSLTPSFAGPLPADVCQYTVPVDVALELPLLTVSLPHPAGHATPPLQHPVEGPAPPTLLLDVALFDCPALGALCVPMVEASGVALQVATMAESGILHDDVMLRLPRVVVQRKAGGAGDAPTLVHVDVQGVEALLRPSLLATLVHAALRLMRNTRPPHARAAHVDEASVVASVSDALPWQRHLLTEVALTSAVVYVNDDLECALVHVGLQSLRVEAARRGTAQRCTVKWSQVVACSAVVSHCL